MRKASEKSRVLTLVFTDLADSTALKSEHGDAAVGQLIARHREHVTTIAGQNEGRVIDWAGDGCFLTFETSSAAVKFALQLQQTHANEFDLPGVRIGIHMGEVTEKPNPEGDEQHPRIEGLAVDLASRISGLAKPCQVLMSVAVYQSARQRLDSDILGTKPIWRSRGSHQLKGLDEPTDIREVTLESLEPDEWRDEKLETKRSINVERIAVLPLKRLASGQEEDYFVDGMTDELITELAKIGSLKVLSATTSWRYKDTTLRPTEIAEELEVDAILEGSVQRSETQVRITAQLIDARSDEHLWAESYTTDDQDALALQHRIAMSIAECVDLAVTFDDKKRLTSRSPISSMELDAVLRAKYASHNFSKTGFDKTIAIIEASIDRFPESAELHALHSRICGRRAVLGGEASANAYFQAKTSAERALLFGSNCAAAQIAMCYVCLNLEWDADRALEHGRRAIDIGPNDVDVLQVFGWALCFGNQFKEARARLNQAAELSPFDVGSLYLLGVLNVREGKFEMALEILTKAVEFEPGYIPCWSAMGYAHLGLNQPNEAIRVAETALEHSQRATFVVALAGAAYAMADSPERTRDLLEELEERQHTEHVDSAHLGLLNLCLTQNDMACQHFELALKNREFSFLWLQMNHIFERPKLAIPDNLVAMLKNLALQPIQSQSRT